MNQTVVHFNVKMPKIHLSSVFFLYRNTFQCELNKLLWLSCSFIWDVQRLSASHL